MNDWKKQDRIKEKDDYHLYEEQELDLDDEEDGIPFEKETKLLQELDPDLIEYFSETHLLKRKSLNGKRKREKKEKITFTIGEAVKVNDSNCVILCGPYEQDGKVFYEIETSNGSLETVEERQIQKV